MAFAESPMAQPHADAPRCPCSCSCTTGWSPLIISAWGSCIFALVCFLRSGRDRSVDHALAAGFSHHDVVSPAVFNRLFTMHGTTMVFLVGMPIILGMANYLVPLMIGARDLAFPRLNAFGFWLSLFGGLLLYFSYLGGEGLSGAGTAPDVGWFAYAPLTERAFSRGHSTDYWILSLLVGGIGSVATSINIVTTVLLYALQGHDAGPYAPLCVVVAGRGRDDSLRHATPDGGPDHAAPGPLPRGPLFRYAGGRLRRCYGSTFSGSLATPKSIS